MKGVDFNFNKVNPIAGEADTEDFYLKFPTGGVPALQDSSVDFCGKPFHLTESNAILTYLSSKYQWNDLYPTNIVQRAKVDQWLHWHHSNMRLCTTRIFRPRMKAVMGVELKAPLIDSTAIDKMLRPSYLVLRHEGLLGQRPFLAGGQPTLADIAVYCELDQLYYANLLNMSEFSDIEAWMCRLRSLPHHDEVRRTLFKFVDLMNKGSSKP